MDRGPLRGFKPAKQTHEEKEEEQEEEEEEQENDAACAAADLAATQTQAIQALADSQDGEYQTPQRAGTCYYRCILAAFNVMLKRRGFDGMLLCHFVDNESTIVIFFCGFPVDKISCIVQFCSESKLVLQSRWPTSTEQIETFTHLALNLIRRMLL